MSGFWNGKTVLVTGHTGFKGSWLSLWLARLGSRVHGLALPPWTDPSLFEAACLAELIDSQIGDVRQLGLVKEHFGEVEPDVVFHLAAQPLVRRSYSDPVETFETNVMGTVNVLEAARSCDSVKCVVIVTSDKCYENLEWPWAYREVDRLGGHDPYSSSKACAEMVSAAYRSSFGSERDLRIATVRAGNVIGGGDWSEDRLVPDAMRSWSSNQPLTIRNPGAVRPWQHVLDPLHGYMLLAERMFDDEGLAQAWNFGPDQSGAISVKGLLDELARHWKGEVVHDAGDHPHEAGFLQVDSSKARQLLQWRPKLDFEQAVAWTAKWYRSFYSGENSRDLTIGQIEHYMQEQT